MMQCRILELKPFSIGSRIMMKSLKTLAIISFVCATAFGCAEDFTDDINELNELLANLNNVTNEQQQKIDEYKDQIEKLNSDLDDANLVIDSMTNEVAEAKEQVEASKKETEKAKEDVDKAIKEVNEATEKAKKSEEAVNAMNETVDNLNSQITELNETTESQQKEIEGYKEELDKTNAELNETKESVESSLNDINSSIDDLNSATEEINDTIDNLNVSKDGDRIVYPVTTYPDGSQSVSTQPFDTVLEKWCYYKELVYKDVSATCCLAPLTHSDKNPLNEEIRTFWLWRDYGDGIEDSQLLSKDKEFSKELIEASTEYNRLQEMYVMPITDIEMNKRKYIQYDKLNMYCRSNDEACLTYLADDKNKNNILSNNYFFSQEFGDLSEGDIILAQSIAYRVVEQISIGSSFYIHKLEEIGVDFVSKIFFCKQ